MRWRTRRDIKTIEWFICEWNEKRKMKNENGKQWKVTEFPERYKLKYQHKVVVRCAYVIWMKNWAMKNWINDIVIQHLLEQKRTHTHLPTRVQLREKHTHDFSDFEFSIIIYAHMRHGVNCFHFSPNKIVQIHRRKQQIELHHSGIFSVSFRNCLWFFFVLIVAACHLDELQ